MLAFSGQDFAPSCEQKLVHELTRWASHTWHKMLEHVSPLWRWPGNILHLGGQYYWQSWATAHTQTDPKVSSARKTPSPIRSRCLAPFLSNWALGAMPKQYQWPRLCTWVFMARQFFKRHVKINSYIPQGELNRLLITSKFRRDQVSEWPWNDAVVHILGGDIRSNR